MATSPKNVAELEAEMTRRIQKALNNKVKRDVRGCVQKHIQEDVFATYEPRKYKRRTAIGINADRNIVGEVKETTLTVKDTAKIASPIVKGYTPQDGDGQGLTALIEKGAHNLFGLPENRPFLHPRPFMTNAKKEIQDPNSAVHKAILADIAEQFPKVE